MAMQASEVQQKGLIEWLNVEGKGKAERKRCCTGWVDGSATH
jgi:hypothetical protein